jgi:Zn-dependent M28 family amino/carboxypeptidase
MKCRTYLLAASVSAFALATAGAAMAANGVDSSSLRKAVKAGSPTNTVGIYLHLKKLQDIANAETPKTRSASSPGYAKSVDYVIASLDKSYYDVTVQTFTYPYFEETAEPVLTRILPSNIVYDEDDFATMEYSGQGDVTAAVVPVDLMEPPGATENSSTSGCELTDFPAAVAGNIALIQRGTCPFAQKAQNAQAKGAVAVVIYNEGQPGRTEVLNGTLGGTGFTIPIVGTSYAAGRELAVPGATARVAVSAFTENRQSKNVLAQSKAGRSDRVVVVGAHLDSVAEGPGIQDNGSGSGAILEIARQMSALKVKPVNKVRFAWWGAEEAGLLGSEHYVSTLSTRAVKDIAVNLNFDMIASPNAGRFVYDGDGSDTPDAGPNGSKVVEDVFLKYFAAQRIAVRATAFDGRSDYGPFIEAGIPAGGLFTGAEDIKTAEEAALFGGQAGVAFDECYHQACDDLGNVNWPTLELMSDAAAHAVLTFAMTTSAVNGTDKGNSAALKALEAGMDFRANHLRK